MLVCDPMLSQMARRRSWFVYAFDVAITPVVFLTALWLRLGEAFDPTPAYVWSNAILLTVCAAVVFRVLGLYRGLWRYASLNDLVSITKAVTATVLVWLPLAFLVTRLEDLPRSLPLILWMLLMAGLGAPRFGWRLFKDGLLDLRPRPMGGVPVLLVGSGDGAELFVRAMAQMTAPPYRVLGLVDTEGQRVGWQMRGVEVIGPVNDIVDITERLGERGERPQRWILADDHLDGDVVARLLDLAETQGVTLSRVPQLTDLRSGRPDEKRLQLRPIAIEDLLNRPQARLDREAPRALVAGRRVLVTGAGGSIGSELVRQLVAAGPAKIVLFDSSEYLLYLIDHELGERAPELDRLPVIGDVRDRAALDRVFASEKPDIVVHAAALKHVPMVEYNPCEGVLTNVSGSRNVADACRAHGVQVMVMVSTDKAVHPTNVMGATKRAAESWCQALDVLGADGKGTRYVTVRFGNVLGSNGSVVPLFQKQLERGGPITVTHPEMTRYFMTIREAVELVIQAAALRAREARDPGGRLFVLDMGEPVKIVDLARQMVRLAGLRPGLDVPITFVGLRPGEKLHEELFYAAEELVPTSIKGVMLASPRRVDHAVLTRMLDGLIDAARRGDEDETIARLKAVVPEFTGRSTVIPFPAERSGP